MVRILLEDLPFSPDDVDTSADVRSDKEPQCALYCVLAGWLYEPRVDIQDGWKLAVPPPGWPNGQQGNAAIARLLFTSGAITTKDAPPLVFLTALSGDFDGLAVLMEAGVDPDSPSPLHPEGFNRALSAASAVLFGSRDDAVVDRQLAVIEVLLKHGADIDHVNSFDSVDKQTLLESAVITGTASSLRLVKLLLKYNATMETRSTDFVTQAYADATPLMLAAGYGNYKAVGALLKAGASAELTDARGRTPLMLAVSLMYHPDSGHGEDPRARSDQDMTAGFKKMLVHSLRATTLIAETGTGKAGMEARDNQGHTALAFGMFSPSSSRLLDSGKHRLLKLLLDSGANPNGWYLIGYNSIDRDPDEAVTPLMMAALWCGFPTPTAEGLLELAGGYVPDGELQPGQTRLQLIEQWLPAMIEQESIRYKKMVQVLLEAGADAMIKNHENKTAIDLAVEHGHPELGELMRSSLSETHGSSGRSGGMHSSSRWKSDDGLAKQR